MVDPPWPCVNSWNGKGTDKGVKRGGFVSDRYDLMTAGQLKRLDMSLLAADQAHCFLWTIQSFLPLGLELLSWWGFKYAFQMVWHKPGGPQ